MKLKSLYIKKYKNLSGTYNFEESNAYIALIGLNGSGKSNLLEVISIIFKIISGLCPQNSIGDFSFTYEIDGRIYYAEYWDYNGKLFINNTQRRPSSIISCYSGEDDRLWKHGYEDYYVRFFNAAIAGGEYKPTSLYINKYCWKIAFISLLFSENEEVKRFITDKLHFSHDTVTVQFKTKKDANPQAHDASNWYKRVEAKFGGKEILIDELINNEDVELLCGKYPYLTNDQIVFYYLYFLYMPDKRGTLGLEADKIIESIDIKLNDYFFDNLSEGEKKLILIECITKVLSDENSLVLLDEPDAHTHIAMKKDLLKLISEFEGQTIMTTHSPMFLNKRWDGFDENNIFYLHDGKIEDTEPLKHLAELTDNEIDYFEGSFILSSKYILVVEGKYDDKYLRKAISIFEKSDSKYSKLNDVAIISANSASSAEVIYNQILSKCIAKIEKIVFLFDYDDGGWKDGWKKIDAISGRGLKIIPMFYQDSYPSVNYPTSDALISAANGGQKTIKPDKTYMVEDIFSESAYLSVITPVINSRKYKDFRNNSIGNKGTAIKDYIEKHYNTFPDTAFDGFKTVLDELMNVFNF